MKNKINLRLVLIAILAVLATTIGVTIVYYSLFEKRVQDDLKVSAELLRDTKYFESEDIILDSADSDADGGKIVSVDISNIDFSTGIDQLRITWVNSDGTVLYDNDASADQLANHSDRPEIQQAFATGEGQSVRRSNTMNKNTFYYAILLENGTVIRVATDAVNIWTVMLSALPLILAIIAVIIAVCVLLSHLLTRQLIRPIETMAENIEDTSIVPPYKELEPFANMIRKQHTDILSAAKVRQDFTANVSHELKTPLTAISGYAELIENHMVDEEGQEHFVHEIRKNSERLLSLINDIIRLSELDRSEKEPSFESLDLSEVVGDSMEALQVNAEQRGIHLEYSSVSCRIPGNREMIRELTENLVQNAIRYNNQGGHVWVSVTDDECPKITVKDDGIGIPEDDQKRVFERFYRVDKSRSKETGGTGLGLAIVKHIVELHDAKIVLKSTVGEGTEITVLF